MVSDAEDLKWVLKKYEIHPKEIKNEESDLFFIRDESESFFLHKTSMTNEQVAMWETVFHHANEYKIDSILPVYPTVEGDLYVKNEESIFYLTPYVGTSETINIKDFFRTVATIHKKTKRTFLIQKEDLIDSFQLYEENMKERRLYLRQIIDLFEQQQYMSPFELQVCSHFHVIEDAFEKSIEHVASILKMCEEDENEHIEWSSSLCHNELSTENVLENQVQYIRKWEIGSIENATKDIASLCRNEFLRNEYPLADFIEGLQTYNDVYTMSDLEEHMLSIHMLHPLTYIKTVQSYVSERDEKPVIPYVIELERIFRVMESSFYLLYEFEQQKPNMFSEASD